MAKFYKNRFFRIIAVFSVLTSGLFSFAYTDEFFEISRNMDIFTTLFRELNIYYVDDTKPGDLMKKGIDSMLESLDPYTNYIPESEVEDYRFMTTGQYGGIGALIGQKDDFVIITDPYEGFPAQKSDLRAGDVIVKIDEKEVKGLKYDEVSKLLKGQPNTSVIITIRRPGVDDLIEKEIMREEIKINSVSYYGMLNNNVGYIRLTGFTDKAGREVKEALIDLKSNFNATSLILDLRGNPGGLLHEAVNITNIFIDKGTEVVTTKGKVKEWNKAYKALNSPIDTDMPLAVLVNSGSASASEIVSGSIQDLDRGIIIGQKTFGKVLVQTTRPLSYNAQLKVTTAKYYIPSGRCIQALDYSNRNDDGSVGKVPDSLISVFKTSKGRLVYDGGGIEPDFSTDTKSISSISKSLLSKQLIFDYATLYRLNNEEISSAKEFQISEKDYDEFIVYLADKEYDYTTQSEEDLENLMASAEKEMYFEAIKPEYEALKSKMMHDKHHDLTKNKEEIMQFLKSEIASRYYYQKGRIEASFDFDKDINKALEALEDSTVFSQIMNRDLESKN